MTKFFDLTLRYDQTTTVIIQGTYNSLHRIKANNEEGENKLLSLCLTLRVKHSLGDYSHREHCRAPGRISDKEERRHLSLCSTLRVKHSLGGYSHREHCRAPDEEEAKIKNQKTFCTWPLGVDKGS